MSNPEEPTTMVRKGRIYILKKASWRPVSSFTVHKGPDGWYAHAYDDSHGPENPTLYSGGSRGSAKGNSPVQCLFNLLENRVPDPEEKP